MHLESLTQQAPQGKQLIACHKQAYYQWQPQVVHKTFPNWKKVNVLEKVYEHMLSIKLDRHQKTIKHIM